MPSKPAVALLLLASGTAIGEGLPDLAMMRFPTPAMRDERTAYEWLRSQPHGPMLELPVGGPRESTRYLSGTLTHGNRIVNGYSGFGWGLEDLFAGPVSGELANAGELLRAARAVGVRYLLVHRPLYGDDGLAADLAYALGQDHEQVAGLQHFGATALLVLRPAARAMSSRPPDPSCR